MKRRRVRRAFSTMIMLVPLLLAACSFLDLRPFRVAFYSPAAERLDSVDGVTVEIGFSTAADRISTKEAFSLTGNAKPVSGKIGWVDEKTLVFTPAEPLQPLVLYKMRLTTAAEDTHGKDLAAEFDHTFSTRTDFMRPVVESVSPTDHSSTADLRPPISVGFNEAMDSKSLYAAFSISPSVVGFYALSSDGRTFTFTPGAELTRQTDYAVTVAKDAADRQGNTLGADFTSRFRVGTDFVGPSITSVESSDGSITLAADDPSGGTPVITTGWESNQGLVITFSASVLTSSALGAIDFSPSAQYTVAEQNEAYARTVTFDLDGRLAYGTTYALSLAAGIQDVQGKKTSVPANYYFTVDGPLTRPPSVSQIAFEQTSEDYTTSVVLSPYGTVGLGGFNGGPGFFDVFLELAPGASVEPLSAVQALTISVTNNAATFKAQSFELDPSDQVVSPPNPTANNVVLRVNYLIADNPGNHGLVTLRLATTLRDDRGTHLSSEYVLPLNNPD